jgi:hypothetical protein
MANEVPESATSLNRPFPYATDKLVPLHLHFGQVGNSETVVCNVYVPFRCNVRKAYCRSGAITDNPEIGVATIEVTPQTIVTAVIVASEADDAGKMMTLTVADAGPIPAGAWIQGTVTSDAGDIVAGLSVCLLVEPVVE